MIRSTPSYTPKVQRVRAMNIKIKTNLQSKFGSAMPLVLAWDWTMTETLRHITQGYYPYTCN